jgi:hypothetical protein
MNLFSFFILSLYTIVKINNSFLFKMSRKLKNRAEAFTTVPFPVQFAQSEFGIFGKGGKSKWSFSVRFVHHDGVRFSRFSSNPHWISSFVHNFSLYRIRHSWNQPRYCTTSFLVPFKNETFFENVLCQQIEFVSFCQEFHFSVPQIFGFSFRFFR